MSEDEQQHRIDAIVGRFIDQTNSVRALFIAEMRGEIRKLQEENKRLRDELDLVSK